MIERSLFVPEPSYRVAAFLKEIPHATWKESLHFLLDNFPQLDRGEVKWLVDGGTAVFLHRPNTNRHEPPDIDFVTSDQRMVEEFEKAKDSGVKNFDARHVKTWLEKRGFRYSEKVAKRVMRSHQHFDLDGRELLVMNEQMLALSKLVTFADDPPRPKDLEDYQRLKVPREGVIVQFSRLGGIQGGARF